MRDPRFDGVMTALCTMFNSDGSINADMVKAHTEFCIAGGVNTVLASAGSGQYVNTTVKQREDTIKATVEAAAGRVPVLAGVLEPGLGEAIHNAKCAEAAGAEGLVVLPPYYVTVTQEGIYDYYAEIAKSVSIPIIVYNYPARIGTNVLPETLAKMMREIPSVIGVKECADYTQFLNSVRLIGEDGGVFSASDLAFADQVLAGACGGVIAASCILPGEYSKIYQLAKEGKSKEAHEIAFQYYALVKGLFGNGMHPSPLKYAMSLMGQEIGEWLPPLLPPDGATKELLRSELEKHHLLAAARRGF